MHPICFTVASASCRPEFLLVTGHKSPGLRRLVECLAHTHRLIFCPTLIAEP